MAQARQRLGQRSKRDILSYFYVSPDPVPDEDRRGRDADLRRFVEHVALHPKSGGKPAVIGNRQAGWQPLMTAAAPDLVWLKLSGRRNAAPYRQGKDKSDALRAGGPFGGSWLTALTSDISGTMASVAHRN